MCVTVRPAKRPRWREAEGRSRRPRITTEAAKVKNMVGAERPSNIMWVEGRKGKRGAYGALEREISRKNGFRDFFVNHYCGVF